MYPITFVPMREMGGTSGDFTYVSQWEHQCLVMVCFVTNGRGRRAMTSAYLTTVSTTLPTDFLQMGHFFSVYVYSCVTASSLGIGLWYPAVPFFLPRGLFSPPFFPGL